MAKYQDMVYAPNPVARFSLGKESAIKAFMAGIARAELEAIMDPMISMVQCEEYQYITGGRTLSREETKITLFRPSLSDITPPGS